MAVNNLTFSLLQGKYSRLAWRNGAEDYHPVNATWFGGAHLRVDLVVRA